jgi:hypothetical protein
MVGGRIERLGGPHHPARRKLGEELGLQCVKQFCHSAGVVTGSRWAPRSEHDQEIGQTLKSDDFSISDSSAYILRSLCPTMKTSVHFAQSERPVSELSALSRDPALAFRSNPAFRVMFRNPDEIIEGDFDGIHCLTRPHSATAQPWIGTASWRRSPKE